MDRQFKQGYRMHRVLSNLTRLNVDRLDDADRERVETARDLLKEISFLTRPATEADRTPTQTPDRSRRPRFGGTSPVCLSLSTGVRR